MISFNRRTQVFAYTQPVRMHASFDSLFSLVKETLGLDPMSGHIFLFSNRARTTCKALYWDGTGLVIMHKRLEDRQFMRFNDLLGARIEMTAAEFSLFFEGADLRKRFIESPNEYLLEKQQKTLSL